MPDIDEVALEEIRLRKRYPTNWEINEICRLARLGLWAEKHAIAAMKTAVGHEPFQGLEPRPISEALAKLPKPTPTEPTRDGTTICGHSVPTDRVCEQCEYESRGV